MTVAHPTVGSSNESDSELTESDNEDSPHSDTVSIVQLAALFQ